MAYQKGGTRTINLPISARVASNATGYAID